MRVSKPALQAPFLGKRPPSHFSELLMKAVNNHYMTKHQNNYWSLCSNYNNKATSKVTLP